jgi:hypothetical protein
VGKAADRHEHDLRKAEAKEREIRARLDSQGGITSPIMLSIFRYFHIYAQTPRPDLFDSVLQRIDELGLMSLPEHRHSLAGALAAVVAQHADKADVWRLHRLVQTAERLTPPPSDEEVSRPGQAEWLWMSWVVTREAAVLQRVVRLANRDDSVGETAVTLLDAHAHMPEVQAALVALLAKRQAAVMAPFRHAPPSGVGAGLVKVPDEVRAQVTALREHVTQDPAARRSVVLVGWVPPAAAPTPTAATYLIVTTDGLPPIGAPLTWPPGVPDPLPVVVRKATPQQLAAHRQLHDAAEEP